MIRLIISAFIVYLVGYLISSFISWEFNPANWDIFLRVVYVVGSGVGSCGLHDMWKGNRL